MTGVQTCALPIFSYPDWLEHAFGHEVRIGRNAWYFDDDIDWWGPEPIVAIDYLTRLFAQPEAALEWFADSQIAQGLTYLLGTSASGDNGWFYATSVPIAKRVACIEAIGNFFARIFAPRCTDDLSHLNDSPAGPLNTVCYMWWDEFPSIGLESDPHLPTMQEATLRTMVAILQLPSLACQESALHGLGHWHRQAPQGVEAPIDAFLAAHPRLDPRLAAYARSARRGCVL